MLVAHMQMKTLGEVLTLSADFLKNKGIPRARREAEELLAEVLKIARIELYMQFDRPLDEKELEAYRQFIKRKARGEPWQYIVGEVRFLDCAIKVDASVLIPRQETEILAHRILKQLSEEPLAVWDVCCGSGYIGLGLKKARPQWSVSGSDLSEKALETARQNAAANGLEIEFLHGDLLAPFEGRKADVVVCNPPYISEKEYAGLDREVRDFEPKIALVGGATGLEFYERLAAELPPYLNPHAKIFFEIGTGMGESLKKIFSSPRWKNVQAAQDWSGHDRFFSLEIE